MKRECLGVMLGLHRFKRYLYDKELVSDTEHCSLLYLKQECKECPCNAMESAIAGI